MDLSKKYVHTDTNNSNPKHWDLFFLPFYASHFLLTLENLALINLNMFTCLLCPPVCNQPLSFVGHQLAWPHYP